MSRSAAARGHSEETNETGTLFFLPKSRRRLFDEETSRLASEDEPDVASDEARARWMVVGIWSITVTLTGLLGVSTLVF
jgi:hypothetical protein